MFLGYDSRTVIELLDIRSTCSRRTGSQNIPLSVAIVHSIPGKCLSKSAASVHRDRNELIQRKPCGCVLKAERMSRSVQIIIVREAEFEILITP